MNYLTTGLSTNPRGGQDQGREAGRSQTGPHARYLDTVSTTQAGFSAPSISIVTTFVTWTPPGTSVTERISPRARMREPTGTGEGKRTLLVP